MTVRSMTGFARVRRTLEQGELTLSLKSVNHRGLDLHFHLPPEMDSLEAAIRGVLKTGVVRGHLQIHLSFVRTAAGGEAPLNRALLDAYMRAFREAAETYQVTAQPDLNAALRIPGMLSAGQEDGELPEEVTQAILDLAAEAVQMLNSFREREGDATAKELQQRCENIRSLVERIEQIRG